MNDTSILQGKWLWIWNLQGMAETFAQVAINVGARGVILKGADETSVWNQFAQGMPIFRKHGLRVGVWHYLYGNDPVGEAKVTGELVKAGPDFVALDVEMEYSKKILQAREYGRIIRSENPHTVFVLNPWCFPEDEAWKPVPYQEFASFCDAVMPQNYWGDYTPPVDEGLMRSDAQIRPWNLPIFPVGQAYPSKGYTPTPDSYALFEKTCHHLGYMGVSFFRMGDLTPAMQTAVRAMNFPYVSESPVIHQPSAYAEKAWMALQTTKWLAGMQATPHESVTFQDLAVILQRTGILK